MRGLTTVCFPSDERMMTIFTDRSSLLLLVSSSVLRFDITVVRYYCSVVDCCDIAA